MTKNHICGYHRADTPETLPGVGLVWMLSLNLLLWHPQAASTRHVTIAEYWTVSNLVWYGTLWQSPCVTLILAVGPHGNKAWCRRLMLDVTLTSLIEMWCHSLGWIIFVTVPMSLWSSMVHVLLSFVGVWYASILAISFRFTSLALMQSYDYPSTSDIKLEWYGKKSNKSCDITT